MSGGESRSRQGGSQNAAKTSVKLHRQTDNRNIRRNPSQALKKKSLLALKMFLRAFFKRNGMLDNASKQKVCRKLMTAYSNFQNQTNGGHHRLFDAFHKATRVVSNPKHGSWETMKKVIKAIKRTQRK